MHATIFEELLLNSIHKKCKILTWDWTIWSVESTKRYDTSAFHEAFNWVAFRYGRAQKSVGQRAKISEAATKARRVINEKCALQRNTRTERTRRCNGVDEKAESDESGSEDFLISIKFSSRPFSSRWSLRTPKTQDFRVGQAPESAPSRHFQRTNGNAEPKTRTVMEKIAKEQTYVKFSCRSFSSVSEAVVHLPPCSRNSLSLPPSPAVTVASLGSLADLWTED